MTARNTSAVLSLASPSPAAPGIASRRRVLALWEWRYRVGFDVQLRSRVLQNADELSPLPEAHLLREQVEAFSGIVSLEALLNATEEEPLLAASLVASATGETADKILPLLPSGVASVRGRIDRIENTVGRETACGLRVLMQQAQKTEPRNRERELLQTVFGKDLDQLLDVRHRDAEASVNPGVGVSAAEVLESVERFVRRADDNQPLLQRLGVTRLPPFQVQVCRQAGFAEYWPAELRHGENDGENNGEDEDLLLLFEAEDSFREQTLEDTLRHELLGHGVYYEILRRSRSTFVDHGALALLEGYATWCEWGLQENSGPGKRLALLSSLDAPADELARRARAHWLASGYSVRRAEAGVCQLGQWPGFYFSYLLGAAWFELCFREEQPRAFFERLGQRPWGDFFRAWNRPSS